MAHHEVNCVIHATTLVSNTVLQRSGATVALITNTGFEDTLELRREVWDDAWDQAAEFVADLHPDLHWCDGRLTLEDARWRTERVVNRGPGGSS